MLFVVVPALQHDARPTPVYLVVPGTLVPSDSERSFGELLSGSASKLITRDYYAEL